MRPWTQQFGVSWPATLTFFERRYEIARWLEKQSPLRGLRSTEQQLAVFLGDPHHRLTFGADGLEVELLQPEASFDRAASAVSHLMDVLEPRRIVRPVAKFQWLIAVTSDYDTARAQMAEGALGSPGAWQFEDLAVLVDGRLDEPDATFQFECGIVEAAEAPPRLSRSVGRMQVDAPPRRPTLWPLESLPAIAFFCDMRCEVQNAPAHSPDEVIALWTDLRQAAEGVVSSTMEKLGIEHE